MLKLNYWCDEPHASFSSSIQGREPYVISLTKINISVYSDFHTPISVKFAMMTETAKFYTLIPVWTVFIRVPAV